MRLLRSLGFRSMAATLHGILKSPGGAILIGRETHSERNSAPLRSSDLCAAHLRHRLRSINTGGFDFKEDSSTDAYLLLSARRSASVGSAQSQLASPLPLSAQGERGILFGNSLAFPFFAPRFSWVMPSSDARPSPRA